MNQLIKSRFSLSNVLALLNSAWGQGANALLALAGVRLYTELMSKQQFGYAMLAMGVLAFIDGIFIMAFTQTVLSLCGRIADAREQESVAAGLAVLTARTVLAALGTAVLLLAGLSYFVPKAIGWAGVALFAAVYISSELLKSSMMSPMAANRQYFRCSLWASTEAAAVLILTAAGLRLVGPKATVYLGSLIVARVLIGLLYLGVYFKGSYFRNLDLRNAIRYRKLAIEFGWPVSVMAPLGWASTYLDRYILSAMGGAAITGGYTATVSLVARPFALTSSVLTNFFRPRLYTAESGPADMTRRWTVQLAWIGATLTIGLMAVVCFAVGGSLIADLLLGRTYRTDATFLLVVMSIAQTFVIMTHAVDNAILSTGASAKLLTTQAYLAVATAVLVPIPTYWFGARGAVLGRCAAEGIKFVVTLRTSCRVFGRSVAGLRSLAPATTAMPDEEAA